MRAKPQFRQHFILTLLDICAHVSARSGSASFLLFFLVLSFFPAGSCGFWICVACMLAKPQFRQHFIFLHFQIRAHGSARSVWDIFFSPCLSCHFVTAASCEFWIVVACMRPKPQFWQQLVLNLISLGVPRAYAHLSIYAQTIIPFVFQEHAIATASMPKPHFRSCSKCIRSPENPCPNHNSVRVPSAYDHERIHAQTIITFVFQEHAITAASMPKP